MVTSATKVVGLSARLVPESEKQLSSLLAAKCQARNQVLCDDDAPASCKVIKSAVCDAKQVWLKKTAEAAKF